MNDPQIQGITQTSDPALAPAGLLGGKPLLPDKQFIIAQANETLSTLVNYEAQYKNDIPHEIQRRILALTDFIHEQLKAMGNASKSAP